MDPLRRLNGVQLQDFSPKPLDLTKQISEALDLVKKKANRSIRVSGTQGLRSPRSEFSYNSVCVPLNFSLQAKTLMTASGNGQADGSTGKVNTWCRTGEKTERNGVGHQDAPSERSQVLFPAVETLWSACSRPIRAESISSDDSSVIEVPLSVRVAGNQIRELESTENSPPILSESDLLQDSDSWESRNVPSTSEAENADFFKSAQDQSGPASASSLSHKVAPETKKNNNQQRKRTSASKKATAKRSRKKKTSSLPAFPFLGPEIKLKYASCKEEKRQCKWSNFSPYVRMEFSACTVVNFEEDGETRLKKQRQTLMAPGIVPSTSCLYLGRLGSSGRCQIGEQCCLCGHAASAVGLGDLHGPYHPHGASVDLQTNGHVDTDAKRKVGERWVHEDCSIWSAGVFLVKGRLYGLEEAVSLAQETVCSCCLTRGATLGCFFKGCPKKYHFPCALQAGCVFNEENFTLRCPKHKIKSGASVSRLQNRCRCKRWNLSTEFTL